MDGAGAASAAQNGKKVKTAAQKRRRTEQRRRRRAKQAVAKESQRDMLREIDPSQGPPECSFCYSKTHSSSGCPDKAVIKARQDRKIERRQQMKRRKEEAEAAGVREVAIDDRVRVVFAPLLVGGEPLTSVALISMYHQLCARAFSRELPDREKDGWNLKVNMAVRVAMTHGLANIAELMGHLVL
ncbi:hypothetical protein KVR01_003087 [Diaporthe batatas]|uniref:uncharacterized protein n=1 Tax=Diaporthe batatas TaxID=748121 RepID=UPI001D04D258|nr:uncharacterized protein KVR01_003087 [Diaporthe batatas]KAG8167398.1 hypothetical protein KVR01_003087 [Diaporthe batatas]